ncbi:MAG: non-canonical purine NTP pyrophosphatase, partial [Myxococcales bacterium]|nr:non-canonical purine NTP pyrophosphatase [Myxococcales bacterium]
MKLLVATSNAGKMGEIREILAPLGFELLSLQDAALPPPDETGVTFQDNAAMKATECAAQSGLWTLADDSGLCVDALGGAPGVRSARYAATDEERRAKVLKGLQG